MRKLTLPRLPDVEGPRHTLSCGQYRLTAEISEFLDRVWAAGEPRDRDEAS